MPRRARILSNVSHVCQHFNETLWSELTCLEAINTSDRTSHCMSRMVYNMTGNEMLLEVAFSKSIDNIDVSNFVSKHMWSSNWQKCQERDVNSSDRRISELCVCDP